MSEQMIFPDSVPFQQLPHVTVLIANYNNEAYLEAAIASALGQNYPKMGVLLVDDKSTDSSWDLVYHKFFKKVPHENGKEAKFDYRIAQIDRFPFYAMRLHENSGPSIARNFGIEESIAATDIFCILDADDEMYPNKVTRLAAEIMQAPNIGVAYADYDIVNTETGNVLREYKEPYSYNRLTQECIVHSGSAIRKEALLAVKDENGYYDAHMRTCEDYDLWIRIGEKFMIMHVAEALTAVRVHPQNSTSTVDKKVWEQNWQRIAIKAHARHV